MKRIDKDTAVADKFGTGKPGFTEGSSVSNTPPTQVGSDWFDNVQEEICNVIEGAGGTLDEADKAQMLDFVRSIGVFGDGDDGSHTTSGDETLTEDVVYTDLELAAGDTIYTAGYKVFVLGDLTMGSGTFFRHDGEDGATLTAGAGAAAGSLGQGEDGGSGGPAGNGGGGDGDDTPLNAYGLGGDGGDGGTATGSNGTGGAVTSPSASFGTWRRFPQAATGRLEAATIPKLRGGGGGGGGAGDSGNAGGGGGGGGVMVIIVGGKIIDNGGTFQAKGGAGGDAQVGGDAGGGGGGGGGCVVVICKQPSADLPTIDVGGGAGGGGADANDGQDGEDGHTCHLR